MGIIKAESIKGWREKTSGYNKDPLQPSGLPGPRKPLTSSMADMLGRISNKSLRNQGVTEQFDKNLVP